MDELNKIVKYNSYLLVYGELLSNAQKEILESYYGYNLSLSEIAENRKVSRAAVEDAIKKGEKKLDEFELKLGIIKKNNEIIELMNKAKGSNNIEEIKEILNDVERRIK